MTAITTPFDFLIRQSDAARRAGTEELPASGRVETYQLGQAISQAADALRSSSAPWVVIMDDTCGIPTDAWQAISKHFDEPAVCGLTCASLALDRVFGRNVQPLPPWFSVLRRDALEATGFFESPFETAEFRLLELADRLGRSGKVLRHVSRPRLDLDSRRWAAEVICRNGALLRDDYARFRSDGAAGREALVPPQFRVTSTSQPISLPAPASRLPDAVRQPTFSVLCPVYKPQFLRPMIESIRAQSWHRWELLIAVDGPPLQDQRRILKILEGFAEDPRITWRLQSNSGTGPTRHRLAQEATGDFIVCIDDDDMLVPETLAVFAAAIDAYPTGRVFRAGARLVGLVEQYLAPRCRLLVDGVPNDPFEVTQPYAIHRSTLDEVGGFEWDDALRCAGEDTILFHKLDAAGVPCLLIDQPLYLRRLSTHNLSLEFELEQAMSHFQLLDDRFCPPPWQMHDRRHAMDDNFQRATTVYTDAETGREVVGSTRFFQYQTLGDLGEVTIDLEITSACNADCGFCPREHLPNRKGYMPLEVVEELARQLRDNRVFKQVVLCGIGESTLHPDLDRIVELLSGAGTYVGMTTNGSFMSPERFATLVDKGMRSFNFSLNAASAQTHSQVMRLKGYDGIVENLRSILELKQASYPDVLVHVSFVVCTLNEHEVLDFVAEWEPRGVTQVWLHPVNNRAGLLGVHLEAGDIERFSHQFETDERVLVDIFREAPEDGNLCKIAKSLIFISAEGETRLCAMDYQRVTSYGRVQDKNLQQSHFEKLRAYATGKLDGFCQGCDFCPAELRESSAPILAVVS